MRLSSLLSLGLLFPAACSAQPAGVKATASRTRAGSTADAPVPGVPQANGAKAPAKAARARAAARA